MAQHEAEQDGNMAQHGVLPAARVATGAEQPAFEAGFPQFHKGGISRHFTLGRGVEPAIERQLHAADPRGHFAQQIQPVIPALPFAQAAPEPGIVQGQGLASGNGAGLVVEDEHTLAAPVDAVGPAGEEIRLVIDRQARAQFRFQGQGRGAGHVGDQGGEPRPAGPGEQKLAVRGEGGIGGRLAQARFVEVHEGGGA